MPVQVKFSEGTLAISYRSEPAAGLFLAVEEIHAGHETPAEMATPLFASTVHLQDETKHLDQDHEISMNQPLVHGKYTFYQSGILPSGTGTVLTVASDPGLFLKYLGSIMTCAGTLIVFVMRSLLAKVMPLLSSQKTTESKEQFMRRAIAASLAFICLAGSAFGASSPDQQFDWNAWRSLPGPGRQPAESHWTASPGKPGACWATASVFTNPETNQSLDATAFYVATMLDSPTWDKKAPLYLRERGGGKSGRLPSSGRSQRRPEGPVPGFRRAGHGRQVGRHAAAAGRFPSNSASSSAWRPTRSTSRRGTSSRPESSRRDRRSRRPSCSGRNNSSSKRTASSRRWKRKAWSSSIACGPTRTIAPPAIGNPADIRLGGKTVDRLGFAVANEARRRERSQRRRAGIEPRLLQGAGGLPGPFARRVQRGLARVGIVCDLGPRLGAYPAARMIDLEVAYNHWAPFRFGWVLMLVACLCVLLQMGSGWKILIIWIAVAILRPGYWREWVYTIIGFSTPYLFLYSYYYLADKDFSLQSKTLLDYLYLHYSPGVASTSYRLFLVYLAVLVLIAGLSMTRFYSAKKILARRTFMLLLWWVFISIGVFLFLPSVSTEILIMAAVPISYLLAHFFMYVKTKLWIQELLFDLFLSFLFYTTWIR